MTIDPKFVELTADVLGKIFMKYIYIYKNKPDEFGLWSPVFYETISGEFCDLCRSTRLW